MRSARDIRFSHVNYKCEVILLVTPTASSVDAGLVAGGVGGVLFLVIIVLVIIVCVLVCQVRRRGHVKFISGELKVNSPQLT